MTTLTYLRPHLAIGKTVLRLAKLMEKLTLDQRRQVVGHVNRRLGHVLSMPTDTREYRQYQVMAAYDVWTSFLERVEAYTIFNQWDKRPGQADVPPTDQAQEAP